MRLVVAGHGPAWRLISGSTPKAVPVANGEPLVDGDVLLSVGYDRILTQAQIDSYRFALNLHFGPLPEYRGCFPTKWTIINGERSGVTLHHLTAEVDAGPVLEVRRFANWQLTDQQVYEHANTVAWGLWCDWRDRILTMDIPAGTVQDETRARYYPRTLPYDGRMPVGADAGLVDRLRRAFIHPPYPGLVE